MGIAAPVVEGLGAVVTRALVALGVGAAAHEITKEGAQPRTRDCADAANEAQCNQCRLQQGFIDKEPRYVTGTTRINYDYQLYIANLHAGPERFCYVASGDNTNTEVDIGWGLTKNFFGSGGKYTVTEWRYNMVMFDGFWRALCTVVEAKANYEDMWDEDGGVVKPWGVDEVTKWVTDQLPSQLKALEPSLPQAKLEWHFMQSMPYEKALDAGMPSTVARLTPFPIMGL